MVEFSPTLEDRPMVTWLGEGWQGDLPAGSAVESLPSKIERLAAAGFGSIALTFPSSDSDIAASHPIFAFMAGCQSFGLPVWLRVPSPDLSRAPGLHYLVQDVGTAMIPSWQIPSGLGTVASVVAAPLTGQQVTPQWGRALPLHNLRLVEQRKKLQSLADDAGVRIWIWSESTGTTAKPNQADNGSWLNSLPSFLQLCSEAQVRESIAGIYLDASLAPIPIDSNRFPWLPGLPAKFLELHGYDLLDQLPSLVADTGSLAVRVRQHYWSALHELHQETCWQPLKEQVGLFGLKLQGSAVNETSTAQSVASSIGATELAAYLSTPGVISPLRGEKKGDRYLQACLAGSAAVLSGQKQTLAQTWNGADWRDTPQTSLAHLHTLLHAGITRLATQAAVGSAETSSAVPSILQQPYGFKLAFFNEYLARSCALLAGGRAGARVALLWPERSLQAHYNPRGHRITRWVEEDLNSTVALLEDLHFDFLFLEEAELNESEIECADGRGCALRCGATRHAYEMVVLPSVSALSRQAWRKLEKFVRAGGRVVCLGLLPRWSENGRDEEFEGYVGKATMIVVADLYDAYAQAEGAPGDDEDPSVIGYPIVRSWASGGRLGCYQPRLNADTDDARLRVRQMLSESLTPEMETQATDVLLTRRLRVNGELIQILNTASRSQRINLRVRPLQPGTPYICNAWNGEVTPLLAWMPLTELDGGGLALPLELAAGAAQFLWIEYGPSQPHVERSNFVVTDFDTHRLRGYATESGVPFASVRRPADDKIERWQADAVSLPFPLQLSDGWQGRRLGPNALKLQNGECRPGSNQSPDKAGSAGWQNLDSSMPANFIKRLASPDTNGILSYRGSFHVAEPVSHLWLRIAARSASLTLDGNALLPQGSPFPAEPLWSGTAVWFDLSAAGQGSHSLQLTATLLNVAPHVLPFPVIVGEFDLSEDEVIYGPQQLEMEAGPWQAQGLPYYSGALELRRSEAVPPEWANCRVFLELAQIRDTVEAIVNGQSLGMQVAMPFRFDLTGVLHPGGDNEILLRFWNTADAVKGNAWDEPAPAGLLGPARLVAYPLVEIKRPL